MGMENEMNNEKKIKFLTVKDGREEGVNQMVEIEEGMEKSLQNCIDHLIDCGEEIEISYGTMTEDEYRESGIQSIMYSDGCTRELAIEILEDN